MRKRKTPTLNYQFWVEDPHPKSLLPNSNTMRLHPRRFLPSGPASFGLLPCNKDWSLNYAFKGETLWVKARGVLTGLSLLAFILVSAFALPNAADGVYVYSSSCLALVVLVFNIDPKKPKDPIEPKDPRAKKYKRAKKWNRCVSWFFAELSFLFFALLLFTLQWCGQGLRPCRKFHKQVTRRQPQGNPNPRCQRNPFGRTRSLGVTLHRTRFGSV